MVSAKKFSGKNCRARLSSRETAGEKQHLQTTSKRLQVRDHYSEALRNPSDENIFLYSLKFGRAHIGMLLLVTSSNLLVTCLRCRSPGLCTCSARRSELEARAGESGSGILSRKIMCVGGRALVCSSRRSSAAVCREKATLVGAIRFRYRRSGECTCTESHRQHSASLFIHYVRPLFRLSASSCSYARPYVDLRNAPLAKRRAFPPHTTVKNTYVRCQSVGIQVWQFVLF